MVGWLFISEEKYVVGVRHSITVFYCVDYYSICVQRKLNKVAVLYIKDATEMMGANHFGKVNLPTIIDCVDIIELSHVKVPGTEYRLSR